MKSALNCWPWVRSLNHSPEAVTCRDRGRVADDGDEVAVAPRLYAQHAKAVLGIVERHPLDGASDYLAIGLGDGGRRGHRPDDRL
jgi:hypothetical protein